MAEGADGRSRRDGFERSLKIGLALFVLVAAVVYGTLRQGEILEAQIAEEASRQASADRRPRESAQPPGQPMPGPRPELSPSASGPSGRDVTPPTITAPPMGGQSALTRLPPRAPLTSPEAENARTVEGRDIRLRLLARPVAIDSATFLVARGKLRLSGVTPVSPSRECGEAGAVWPCGMQARTALRSWLRARSIRCEVPEKFGESDETIDSECSLGAEDVGQWLVENGWARASEGSRYEIVEEKARDGRRGIWGDGPRTQ